MGPAQLGYEFGISARANLRLAHQRSLEGAIACLESLYYSYNNHDFQTYQHIWDRGSLLQLAGVVHRPNSTDSLERICSAMFLHANVEWVRLTDIIYYFSGDMIVFTGMESGVFTDGVKSFPLKIRMTRIFGYSAEDERWGQLYQQGAIDDPELLARYQQVMQQDEFY